MAGVENKWGDPVVDGGGDCRCGGWLLSFGFEQGVEVLVS